MEDQYLGKPSSLTPESNIEVDFGEKGVFSFPPLLKEEEIKDINTIATNPFVYPFVSAPLISLPISRTIVNHPLIIDPPFMVLPTFLENRYLPLNLPR